MTKLTFDDFRENFFMNLNNDSNPNNNYEVHEKGCHLLPDNLDDFLDLGEFTHCSFAINVAKFRWAKLPIDGCASCCSDCNNG